MTSPPDQVTIPKRRWYAPTPAKFVSAMFLMQGVLFLSSRHHWFWFNERKGYTVLVALAATTIGLLLLGIGVLLSRFTRWKAQFGIATTLWIMAVMAIPCGWMAREIELARRQRVVVADLKSHGVLVWYQEGAAYDEMIMQQMIAQARPAMAKNQGRPFLENLTTLLGRDFFDDVSMVLMRQPDDAALEAITELRQLPAVQLVAATITDKGMRNLARLQRLKSLEFEGSSDAPLVGDIGLESMNGLTQLDDLILLNTDLTDAGLIHLQELKALKSLTIDCYHVTDQGLLQLAELKELRTLRLLGGKITDDGVQELKKALPQCRIMATPYR